jgi:endonuclease-3
MPSPFKPPSRARVRRIRERLRSVYGVPAMAPHGHPIAELILTVLSQSTNDRNRDVAYLRMRERLPSWEAVRDAPAGELEEAIRPGGISKVKSVRIQAILRAISADPRDPGHGLSLDWMRADFVGDSPPGRIAASTSPSGASRTATQSGKRSRRRR